MYVDNGIDSVDIKLAFSLSTSKILLDIIDKLILFLFM